ncbi:MAG TPA: hypothetical protein VIL30_26390 [Ramlibacter sp.]|jgi:hypothetical protein
MPLFDGKPKTLAEIVLDCQRPGYELYRFKKGGDHDIVFGHWLKALFEGREIIAADEVAEAFQGTMHTGFSLEFEAKRGGEVIRWGVDNGILSRVPGAKVPAWRINAGERELLFVQVGASRSTERKVRTRRWASAEEEKADRAALKRWAAAQERARVKKVAASRVIIERQLTAILARDVEVEARGELLQYTAPGITKLVEIQGYILQQLDSMPVGQARAIDLCLVHEYADILSLPLPLEPAPEISDEDLAILGDI